MKHIISICFLTGFFCLFCREQVSARIWRVNNIGVDSIGSNVGGTIANPVFNQLTNSNGTQGANANFRVQNGDTIHLEGSAVTYVGGRITKRLVIIGSGFLLNENPNTSYNLLPSKISSLTFFDGSSGSQVMGVWLASSGGAGGFITIWNDITSITVKRCKIDWNISFNGDDNTDIYFTGNFFDRIVQDTFSCINLGTGAVNNLNLVNNIFKKRVLLDYQNQATTVNQCNNNVFDCPALANSPSLWLNAASFRNNILKTAGAIAWVNQAGGGVTSHNVSASASGQFGTANNNLVVPDMNTIFVDAATNSTDGDYQLKNAWTDIAGNAGADGTQRGAFGGTAISNRYALSGLPPIPVIYEVTTSGVSDGSGLPVSIKAKTIQ